MKLPLTLMQMRSVQIESKRNRRKQIKRTCDLMCSRVRENIGCAISDKRRPLPFVLSPLAHSICHRLNFVGTNRLVYRQTKRQSVQRRHNNGHNFQALEPNPNLCSMISFECHKLDNAIFSVLSVQNAEFAFTFLQLPAHNSHVPFTHTHSMGPLKLV